MSFQGWVQTENDRRTAFLGAVDEAKLSDPSFVHTGVVLSGGGARGDFQVGALEWLFANGHFAFSDDPSGFQVKAVSGCSVGSLNAVKLAEGPGSVAGLKSVWQGINSSKDLYDLGPEVAALKAAAQVLQKPALIAAGSRSLPAWAFDLSAWKATLSKDIQKLQNALVGASVVLGEVDQLLASIVTGTITVTSAQLATAFNPIPAIGTQLQTNVASLNSLISTLSALIASAEASVNALLTLNLKQLSKSLTNAVADVSALPGEVAKVATDTKTLIETPVNNLVTNLPIVGNLITALNNLVKDLKNEAAAVSVAPLNDAINAANAVVAGLNGLLAGASLTNANSLFRLQPLHSLVNANVDWTKVFNSGIELHVGFVSLETGEYRWADEGWPSNHLANAIIASCAIPVIFAPVQMELVPIGTGFQAKNSSIVLWGGGFGAEGPTFRGEHYADGGLRLLAPLAPVLEKLRNEPTNPQSFHLNQVFVLSCSSLTIPTWNFNNGYGVGHDKGNRLLNLLGRTLDLFLNTTLYESLGDAHLEYRAGAAEALAVPPSVRELRDEFRVFQNAIIWAGGEPVQGFPTIGQLNKNNPALASSTDPMPGDTIIWLIDVDPTYQRLRDALDMNGTPVPGSTIINEGIDYGSRLAEWVMKGMSGPRPTWTIMPDFDMFA